MKKYDVNVLRNEHVGIRKGEQEINLLGIDDPEFVTGNRDEGNIVKDAILKAKFEMLQIHLMYYYPIGLNF